MPKKTLLLALLLIYLWGTKAAAVTVMVDPGHGGADPGAVGHGLREKDINLDIALRVREELAARGFDVLMTRTEDESLSLKQRVNLARNSQAELFVSIHANAHTDERAKGSLVLYYDNRFPQPAFPASKEMRRLTPDNAALAQAVLDGLLAEAGTVNLGIVPSSVYVVRNGRVPSILVETAFISNASDASLLASETWRKKAALGIADGIADFASPVFPDIAGHWARAHIARLESHALVGGYAGRFEPDRSMTRAEFLVLLDRVFHFSALTGQADPHPGGSANGETVTDHVYGSQPNEKTPVFTDLPVTHWAYGQLQHAAELGIANGYEDGRFRPDGPVSRAEMAVLLGRVMQLDPPAGHVAMPFADIPANSWYTGAVATLYRHALVGGVTATEFQPHKALSRAEAAAIIDRFLSTPAGIALLPVKPDARSA